MSDSANKNRQIDDHEDDDDDDSEDDGRLEGARVVDGGPSSNSGTTGASATSQQAGAAAGQGEGQASPRATFTHSLPVPEHKMGWIIGKAGVNITALSTKSGANISVSDSTNTEFGMKWNYIQITGTGRTVDRAKKLILLRLERLDSTNSHETARNYSEQSHRRPPSEGGFNNTNGSSSPRSQNNRHFNLDHPEVRQGRPQSNYNNNPNNSGGGAGGRVSDAAVAGRGSSSPRGEGGRGGRGVGGGRGAGRGGGETSPKSPADSGNR